MNKKLIISIISVLIIFAGVGYFLWSKDVKAKEDVEGEELAYRNILVDTLELMDISIIESALLATTYQEYWGKILDRDIPFSELRQSFSPSVLERAMGETSVMYEMKLRQGEFDVMISILKDSKSNYIDDILEQQETIANTISSLKNPPENFKSAYESLLEVYEVYDNFVSISTSPTGSYVSYSSDVNSMFESLTSKTKTLKLQF